MKKDFLLEVLVQELPYKFIPSAISQLKTAFEKLFKEQELDFKNIEVFATQRRLAVIVYDLDVEQKTFEKDVRGPILNIAKNEQGEFTPAALGFAKKNGVDATSLYEKDNYIYAKIVVKGNSTEAILKDNIESLILKLQGAHFMRWGYNSEKFSRPIENVVALFDSDVVDLKILDKTATNKTKGHRYSANIDVTVNAPKDYVEALRKANVIVNQKERQELIIESSKKAAEENNLVINFDDMEELLKEVTFITEYPVPVVCDFEEKYLKIPPIVTTTVMSSHQRYFPLWQKDGKLSNHFITMANYVGNDFSNIKAGNQRVIAARLEDGIFFFNEDTKTKLIDKKEALKGMTFQKGLGTLFDKTERIIRLSEKIADLLGIQDKSDILRAAELSKCDLSTKLVFEFTELQGFIGQNYAELDGEKEAVSKAVSEHYFPLSANSELPSNIESQIVSIADKVDTIAALFISTQGDKKKKRPTGSNDPLGARRAAIGILRTIIEKKISIDLEKLMEISLEMLSKEFNYELEETILDELKEFFIARLFNMYEKEYTIQVFDSLKISNPLRNLVLFVEKLKIITDSLKDADFTALKENALRTSRILKEQVNAEINPGLFVLDEEKALYSAISAHNKEENDLVEYIKSLKDIVKATSTFFDKVLVMDKDEKIKTNRLALLTLLKKKYDAVCDFEKL